MADQADILQRWPLAAVNSMRGMYTGRQAETAVMGLQEYDKDRMEQERMRQNESDSIY